VNRTLDVAFRLLCIGVQRFSALPTDRPAALRCIVRNALRLLIAYTSRQEAAAIALQVLTEKPVTERTAA